MSTDDETPDRQTPPVLSRRGLLGAAGMAGVLAGTAACADTGATQAGGTSTPTSRASTKGSSSATAAPGTATPRSQRPSIASTSGPDIVHGPRSRQEVALTFHGAGDLSLTRSVISECAKAGARITVFAVGQWLAANPSAAHLITAPGHELGNHTWSHQQMPQLDASTADREVARAAAELKKVHGTAGWWFRPSGTPTSTPTIRAAARASGYHRCVSYDVDPQDYRDPGAALVRSRTRASVRPGSIVSLHLGHLGTVQALPGILKDLTSAGLRPVTLSTLLRD